MSEEPLEERDVAFRDQLLGMQGFTAARAKRYRAELEKLLAHRLLRVERWTMGAMGLFTLIALGSLGVMAALNRDRQRLLSPEARWALAFAFLVPAVLIAGWFLWIAFRGGFSRRSADVVGVVIVVAFCGGFGSLFFNLAWDLDEPARMKLLLGGGTMIACMVGCIILTMIQRMHRQTHEKLLRIEYHLAELMERGTP